jgi:LemA protein
LIVYNLLIKDRNRVRASWSDIDVQLKRRYDLIPKLVDVVRQYAAYEQAVMEEVTALRSRAQIITDLKERGEIESVLGADIKRLFAVLEQYPDLKASSNFLKLQRDLTETEDKIQFARRYFNGAVRDYNTRIESFPDLIVARIFIFKQHDFFMMDEKEKQRGADLM